MTEQNQKLNNDLSHFINTSLVDLVADKIRTNIYLGKYPAGHKLVVRELSEEFGVSHTPVKDALNRLISEGYVEALPRRSMVVRSFTNVELIESLEVRLVSEIFYAGEIVRAVKESPLMIEEMRRIVTEMREAISDKNRIDYERWVNSETRFHFCYMKACGNAQMFELYQGLNTNKVTYLAYLGASHIPLKRSILENNIMEHEAILSALEEADAPRFINAVIRHIYRACEDYNMDARCAERIEHLKRVTSGYET